MFKPWPLACAIALAAVPVGTAFAQTSVQTNVLRFDLPAAGLGQTLNAIARQSGQVVSLEPGLVRDKQAPAIRGEMTAVDALQRALQGSGLVLRTTESGNFTVVPAPADGSALELGATNVNAGLVGEATTENSGSYTTGSMQTATKLPLSIRETPQSVTVITRQRMEDQGLNTLQEAVAATPGISLQGSGPQRFGFYARGFEISDVMLDGLPTAYSVGIGAGPIAGANLVMYDRIEVVRGATGLMQGAGNPSGSINLVRKRPTHEFQGYVKGSAGSWDSYDTELDVSGPLNESGSVRARAVGYYQSADSFQDYVSTENSTFYAIGEMDLNADTLLTLGASHQVNRNNDTWGGLAATDASGNDLHLSRSTYLGNDWEYWDQTTSRAFVELERHFDNGWKIKAAANQQWSELDYLGTYTYRAGETLNVSRGGGYRYEVDQQSYDLFASGPFQWLGREHELVLGGSARNVDLRAGGGSGGTASLDIDPANWNYHLVPKPTTGQTFTSHNETSQQGVYVTTRLSLADSLKLILGGRLDWYEYDNLRGDGDYTVTRNVTRYAGLIYDLDAHHSLYASYTDIFQPQSNLDSSSRPLEPVVGTNYEVGIKGEYFDGALNASLAVFQIDQENRARALTDQSLCPTSSTCYEASGVVRSRGVDIEVQGALTSRWQVGGGYTFVQAEYAKSEDAYRKGDLFDPSLPRQQFKLFTSYRLPGDRWRAGGSLSWQGGTYVHEGDYRFGQEAYAVVGVMAGYQATEALDLQFNVDNLFDEHYYRNISGTTYPVLVYGEPRSFRLTARYGF